MRQRELLIVNLLASGLRLVGTLAIAFFLTPILLKNLGIQVFGLLETIGASGLLLSLTTETLNVSISRELTYWLGAADSSQLRKAFSSAFYIQLLAGLAVCAIGILGAEWAASFLTIPSGFERVVVLVLRITALDLGIGFMTSPYWGMIVATQDMRTYSLLLFLKKLATFLAACAIPFGSNGLLTFSVCLFLLNLCINAIPIFVGLRRHNEARPKLRHFSRDSAFAILKYAALTIIGRVGGELRKSGGAVFLNIVFGNSVAAANAVGKRLSGLTYQFVNVVVPVIQPAMTANTGAKRQHVTHRLITATSVLSTAIAIPFVTTIYCDAEALLNIWLDGTVPPYAATFARIVSITMTWLLISKGHEMAMHSTGKVGVLVSVFHAITVSCFILGAIGTYQFQEYPWLVKVFELVGVAVACLVWQPYWVSRELGVPIADWKRFTLLPIGTLAVCCASVGFVFCRMLPGSFARAFSIGVICALLSVFITWTMGFTKTERSAVSTALRNVLRDYTAAK